MKTRSSSRPDLKIQCKRLGAMVLIICLGLTANMTFGRGYARRCGAVRVEGPRGGSVTAAGQRTVSTGYRGVGYGARGAGLTPGVGLGAPGVGVLPHGYYRVVYYRGYNCRYVGGVYYRAVMYGGTTCWVIVS